MEDAVLECGLGRVEQREAEKEGAQWRGPGVGPGWLSAQSRGAESLSLTGLHSVPGSRPAGSCRSPGYSVSQLRDERKAHS